MGKNPEQTQQTLHGFSYSAVKIEDLGASEYTIVTIVQDVSGSVIPFASDMEKTLQAIIEACKKNPRSGNLLIRLITFNDQIQEIHGFVELKDIKPDDYIGILKCYGQTAFMDASLDSAEATEAFGKKLSNMDYLSNGVMYVITDGEDNSSVIAKNPEILKNAFQKIKTGEVDLQSFLTILIGVGDDPAELAAIKKLGEDSGFDQFVEMGNATPARLAKLADFISRSISSTSQALADGQQSQPLTF